MTKISPMKPVLDTSKDYSKRKEQLRKKLKRPFPKAPSRKLTPEQKERFKKHLLRTGKPKIATKGWK